MKAGDRIGELRLHHSFLVGDRSRRVWVCRCSCGKVTKVRQDALKSGATRSCGHLQKDYAISGDARRIHSLTGSPEWVSYHHMIARCYKRTDKSYPDYGGRGITVCDRWLQSFVNFVEDMGPRPDVGYSLGRKDNDAEYSLYNCEWQTRQEQNRNTRRNRYVSVHGEQVSLAEAAERLGVNYGTLKSRVRRSGYSLSF